MATQISSNSSALTPAPGNPGRIDFPACHSAADVRARTAQVRAFRDRVWPAQRPAALPVPPQPAVKPAAIAARMAAPQTPAARGGVVQIAPQPAGRITVAQVMAATAAHCGLTIEELRSDTRRHRVVRPRQVAEYLAHKLTGRSLPFIAGKLAPGRDHTSTLNSVRKVQARIEAGDMATVEAVNAIVAGIGGAA
jgi:hypothetical protein